MRYYTEISKEDFLSKVKETMEDEEFPYELPNWIAKDVFKISFDCENITSFDEDGGYATYPVGYREINPGHHIFFVNAGGDWEFPVCFIFYWGDGKLRGYTPKDGNAWNKKERSAYDDGEDHDDEINEIKMIEEILKRIVKK